MEENKENSIPWELISQAIENDLTGDEERQFRQWLEADPSHPQLFASLKATWETDMNDFSLYQQADENAAWESLQEKLFKRQSVPEEAKLIRIQSGRTKMVKVLAGAAAVLLIAVFTVFYMNSRNQTLIYETAGGQKKDIVLPDGSKIILYPLTHLEVSSDFNQKNRTVNLKSGKAFFNVQHLTLPFVVSMENSFVKDIGTSFTIEKNGDSIKVDVSEGKVVFGKSNGNETRELTKGMSVGLYIQKNSFGTIIKKVDSSLLEFDNTPLTEVIIKMEEVYGQKMVITSDEAGNRKLTANLSGLSFDDALQVVMTSLRLDYKVNNGVFELMEKN